MQEITTRLAGIGNGKNPAISKATKGQNPKTIGGHRFEIRDDIARRRGQCEGCKKFAESWEFAEKEGVCGDDIEVAVDWAIGMHEDFHNSVPRQLFLLEQAYEFLPWKPPTIYQAVDLNDKLQKKAFEEEYETARLYGQDSRHIWVCFRDPEDEQEDEEDVIHVSYIAVFQNQPTIVYSGTDEVSRDYLLNIVGESDISKEPVFWPKDRNALAQIVTYIEWLARIAIYPEQTYMFGTLYNRNSVCLHSHM